MNLDEMDRNEILSSINDGVLDEAELLELVSDNDFDIALAVAKSSHSTAQSTGATMLGSFSE